MQWIEYVPATLFLSWSKSNNSSILLVALFIVVESSSILLEAACTLPSNSSETSTSITESPTPSGASSNSSLRDRLAMLSMGAIFSLGGQISSMWTDHHLCPWYPTKFGQPPATRVSWITTAMWIGSESGHSIPRRSSRRRWRAQDRRLKLKSPESHCTTSKPSWPPSLAKKSLK